jgi:FAD/FMN-containing dehydrogenase
MVASDVHGKNHHVAGCFGEYVRALRMRVGDGRVLEIDEASEPELFRATLGGMGLTGHILEVELQLERIPSFWIRGAASASPISTSCSRRSAPRARARRSRPRGSTRPRADRARARDRHERALCRGARGARVAAQMRERFAVPFDLPGWFVGPWSIRRSTSSTSTPTARSRSST